MTILRSALPRRFVRNCLFSTTTVALGLSLPACTVGDGDTDTDTDTQANTDTSSSSSDSSNPTTGSSDTTDTDSNSDSNSDTSTDPQVMCSGAFSNGLQIVPSAPTWLDDVPGDQSFCDFHTFAWNQFIWLISPDAGTPRFMQLAPWVNLFVAAGEPTAYPGGSTALVVGDLDKSQAGDDYDLVDVAGQTVLYDIRFNETMYESLRSRSFYKSEIYKNVCNPDPATQDCQNNLWVPPDAASNGSSLELKTAWRTFATGTCPTTTMYCDGDLGLVGLHLVQKTATHGEWIWASFEHVDNVPDCAPNGSNPIALTGPTGQPWSFFNSSTVPASVIETQTCDVTNTPPICNGNPLVDPSCDVSSGTCEFQSVNICRTDQIPAGGASAANCAIGGNSQSDANNGGNVACLNSTLMPALTGVWQNYMLIGTLWTKGQLSPMQDFRIQTFQTEVTGLPYVEPVGFPNLANATMETWLQTGSTGFQPFGAGYTAGCFSCHNPPSKSFEIDLSHSILKARQ